MSRYPFIFGGITLLLFTAVWLLHSYTDTVSAGSATWLALGFLAMLSWAVHRVLDTATTQRPQRFVTLFMATLTAKLFLSAIAILIAGLIEPSHIVLTALAYMAGYFAYTIAEIVHLLPLLRNPKG